MTTIGIIGAGFIGKAVARLAIDSGYDVVVSASRGPEALAGLVADLGPAARAATPQEAAAGSDLVVVAVPLLAHPALPVEALRGKIVMDTTNYYPQRDGQHADLEDGTLTTGELLARRLPGSSVVKAFSSIYSEHIVPLARPAGSTERSALPIAGDDPVARAEVAAFLDNIGYDVVDAGPLAESGRFGYGTPAYCAVYFDRSTPVDALGIPAPQPADVSTVEKLLSEVDISTPPVTPGVVVMPTKSES